MKAFFNSMTGRVFFALMLGIIASAALTQWLALNERQRTLERYRNFHALERAEQIIETADVVRPESRAQYLQVASKGTVQLELAAHEAPALPATEFSAALAQRLGREFQVTPIAERPPSCDKPIATNTLFGATQWRGTCESVQIAMTDGQLLKLSVLPPRAPAPTGHNEYAVILPFLLSIAVLAYLVTRMTVRPLRQLAQAAKDLGNDINHPPLGLTGASEIRQASAAFNAMQARIRQYIAQRTEMLAAITHDLQTPLTRLRLRLEKVTDEDLRQKLIGDLSAMQAMVKEGLDLARSIDAGGTMQKLDLDSLLDSVCADAVEAGQPVELKGSAGMALLGRPLDIQRCLVNLIDNAVKYGQKAHVTVERLAGAARIRVRDEGPGIPQDQLARVFEPFYRLESSRSRASGGTGLGLTIARNIAEQHGATLSLSNGDNGGLKPC
ncbi:ATP-binding protein [Pseudoduganella plicata]|uniref:histidine kinase n=1 Tax=Pseudoduganella plicata TaxID=321984 RepID=A0ABX5SFE7_9BURK|nr:ATP-binding protein [Pseudoduganella plicata]QBQ37970.1 HAMP domain-containing protein [Pseudoduganella plicata]